MTDDLASRAEVQRLARELGCDATELHGLTVLDAGDLRTLRHRLTSALDARQQPTYQRLANASKLLPDKLTAALAQRFFGALLCGKVASSLEPDRAAQLVSHLGTPFLADVSVHVDPAASQEIIRNLDDATLLRVLAELLQRGDHATVGKYISAVSDRQLRAVVPTVDDEADLLLSALAAEDSSRFPTIAGWLTDDLLGGVLSAALDLELFAESLVLVEDVDTALRQRIAGIALDLGETAVLAMVEQVVRAAAWARLVDVMADLPASHYASLAAVAGRDDVPPEFLADLAARIPAEAVATVVGALPVPVLVRVLVVLFGRKDHATLQAYAGGVDDPTLAEVVEAAALEVDVDEAFALLPLADDGLRARLVSIARGRDGEVWERLV